MRKALLAVALGILLVSCDATLGNRAVVYPPVIGKFNLKWTVDVAGTALVIVQLDGAEVGRAEATTGVFSVELDSRKFANGLHRLHLEAHSSAGSTLQTLDHTILISN